jgi:hypothetical protein
MKKQTLDSVNPGKRAAAYWFEDGLPEILAGLVTLGFWLLILVRERIEGIIIGTFIWSGGFTVLLIVLFRNWKILDSIKARLTYPRTGYVSPPADPPKPQAVLTLFSRPTANRNVSNFKAMLFMAIAIGGDFYSVSNFRWGLAVSMLIISLLMLLLTFRDVHKYTWLSVLPIILAGIFVEVLILPGTARRSMPCLILGGWFILRGLWLLVRFLRMHPHAAECKDIS